jgi:RNA polymerase sigma-54 factor
MSYPLSQNPSQRNELNIKQTQRLMLTHEMQAALHLLQMPILELSELIEHELEENPVLDLIEDDGPVDEQIDEDHEMDFERDDFDVLNEIDDSFTDLMTDSPQSSRTQDDDKKQSYIETLTPAPHSLFDQLMEEAHEVFTTEREFKIAELIIGNLEDSGLFTSSLEDLVSQSEFSKEEIDKVLQVIKTFYPPGIAASSTQEALLRQLEAINKKGTLAYKIIQNHYDELVHNKIVLLEKELKVSAHRIQEVIEKEIRPLNLHPASSISDSPTPYITPDVAIREVDGRLEVSVNNDHMPSLKLNRKYLKLIEETDPETKKFVLDKLKQAKWFMRTLLQRGQTLERIAKTLVQKNREYFLEPEGKMIPLTMKAVAEELELHESTIARAVMNKYIDTPKGLLPLRYFFNSTFETSSGETLSSRSVKDLIQALIDKEDKMHPLSDEKIAEIIQNKGITCARRTVAKFRSSLNIGNAHQRKKF